MEWTTELRYKRYEDWTEEEKKQIKENMANSPWHTHYHVEPKTGLLNDPNGFSYFNGKWILFYQNFPFGAAHGLKSWVQLESDDLVHFKETGLKVLPDTPLDSHGAYSGSAMQFDDKLFLFYTGNVRDEKWIRHPYQIGALLDQDGNLEKIDQILIDQPEDATDHFRDPQIFKFKDQYYAIVGGQDLEKKGFVRLYKAVNNDYTNWVEVGDLDFNNDRTAYMMECPTWSSSASKQFFCIVLKAWTKQSSITITSTQICIRLGLLLILNKLVSLTYLNYTTWTTASKPMQLKASTLLMEEP